MGRAGKPLRLVGASLATAALTALATAEHVSAQPNAEAYVTNENAGTISVFDASGSLTGTIPVVQGPSALTDLAFNPSGSEAYVVDGFHGVVDVIDTSTGSVATRFALNGSAANDVAGIAISPSGNRGIVVYPGSNRVGVFNTNANKILKKTINVGNTPMGVAFAPSGAVAYVANALSNSVSVIDVAGSVVTKTIKLKKPGTPEDVAVSPTGERVYVLSASPPHELGSGTLNILTSTGDLVKSVEVGSVPTTVTLTPSGTEALVANYGGSVSVVNVVTGQLIATIGNLSDAADIAVNSAGTLAYVAQSFDDSGSVSIIDLTTNQVIDTVQTQAGTAAVAFS